MWQMTRRELLQSAAIAAAAVTLPQTLARGFVPPAEEVAPGDRPPQDQSVQILNPRGRVPLSYIIDDSTCLVNMGAFWMPQFRAAFPQNPIYWKPWKSWPREIPNDFVREFGEFCIDQGVRGKYSLIPYPACVGWLDREMPGWSKKDLAESLQLSRDLIGPRFDLMLEMVTHTRVIDIKTNRPLPEANPNTMENQYPPTRRSADELATHPCRPVRLPQLYDAAPQHRRHRSSGDLRGESHPAGASGHADQTDRGNVAARESRRDHVFRSTERTRLGDDVKCDAVAPVVPQFSPGCAV
jgi:hypothetical protein